MFCSARLIGGVLGAALLVGCGAVLYDPALATRPYPEALVQERVVQIQAVPLATTVELVNATNIDYRNVDIWINRRFVQHADALLAGETIALEIENFRDVWGQCPQPGGFWRTRQPTPLMLVQIQRDATSPLIGLVTVVPEEARY